MVSRIVFFSWRVRNHLESLSSLQTRRDFLERVGTQAPGMFILGSFSRVAKYVFLFGQDLAIMGCRQDVSALPTTWRHFVIIVSQAFSSDLDFFLCTYFLDSPSNV